MSAAGVVADPAPTVRLAGTADEHPLAAVLAATRTLAERGAIRLADHATEADLLHTIGDGRSPGPSARRHIHHLARIPLHRHTLVAASGWSWWQRRRTAPCTIVLVHGHVAARLVAAAEIVPGDRLHVLPLLEPEVGPSGVHVGGPGDVLGGRAVRAAVRRRLGVEPGVRVVVGDTSGPSTLRGWDAALRATGRRDVLVVDCADVSAPDLGDLLVAADVFVAAGGELLACSPGVAAVRRGVPTVAVTTDAAAELVEPGRSGYVVPPTATAVATTVLTHLDASAPGWRRTAGAGAAGRGPGSDPVSDLVSSLGRAYTRAMTLSGHRGRP